MKYLLDTDVLINHFRAKEPLKLEIIAEGVGISIITLGELLYGTHKSDNPKTSLIRLEKDLVGIRVNVENLNTAIMDQFARIKADLEKKGKRLEDFDLLIAATALVNNLILVTRNKKHFERIKGLKLAD